MFEKTIEFREGQRLVVTECMGDLRVQVRDDADVHLRVSGTEETAVIEEGEDTIFIRTLSGCRLTMLAGIPLTVQQVHGSLRVKETFAPLNVEQVHGDVRLNGVGATMIGQVHGDVRAREITGDLVVQHVAGDARIYDVDGSVSLEHVGSDLRAEEIEGDLEAGTVGSDARLTLPFLPGVNYCLNVGSDLIVTLPPDPNVSLSLQAGHEIVNHLSVDLEHEDEHSFEGVLGEGDAVFEGRAGSSIVLREAGHEREVPEDFEVNIDFDFLKDLDEVGEMIESRINDAMAALDVSLKEGLRHFDSEVVHSQMERVSQIAQRAAERAQEVAEREAERARRAAERDAQRARIRAERAERRWKRASGHHVPHPPKPPQPERPPQPPKPDLTEERMKILQMVEAGTITPEQATELLAALQ